MNWPADQRQHKQQVATPLLRPPDIINFLQAPSKQSIRAENVIGPSFIFTNGERARATAKIVQRTDRYSYIVSRNRRCGYRYSQPQLDIVLCVCIIIMGLSVRLVVPMFIRISDFMFAFVICFYIFPNARLFCINARLGWVVQRCRQMICPPN